MKKIFAILLITLTCYATAQEKLNNYKYVLIPAKFEFQNTENQYNINLLLKYKFQQMGFDAYLDTDELPRELKTNSCLYIKPLVIVNSTMFKNAVSVKMFNCDNELLFETQEGMSREKSNKTSYNVALRKSLKSFEDYHLEYVEKSVASKNIALEPVLNAQKEVVVLEAEITGSEIKNSLQVSTSESENYLIAKSTPLGLILTYSLSKKVAYSLLATKLKDVYVIENGNGIVYKNESVWVREYMDNQIMTIEYLEIKF